MGVLGRIYWLIPTLEFFCLLLSCGRIVAPDHFLMLMDECFGISRLSPSLENADTHGRYLHPEHDRLLSVREMSLLQGFPPDYQFMGSLSCRYNCIGDSVPPLFSKILAKHLSF